MTGMGQGFASFCRTHDLKEKACLAEAKGRNRCTYPESQYTSAGVKNTVESQQHTEPDNIHLGISPKELRKN